MIATDDNIVCPRSDVDKLGYTALYDTCRDRELPEGIIIAAVVQGITFLFQLDSAIDILEEDPLPVMKGSLFIYLEGDKRYTSEYFLISNCRFPTKEELDWYNSLKTI